MLAYHFLRDDMTAGSGVEPAWAVGEERAYEGQIDICHRGYHSAPSWFDALAYAPGNMACIVEIGEPVYRHTDKYVSRTRKLLAARNVERELRLWGIECAERALLREREHGREPDPRSWQAVEVARRYADGQATKEDLAAAGDAAGDAARAAAWAAARAAARDAEQQWQRQRLDEILNAIVCVGAEVA